MKTLQSSPLYFFTEVSRLRPTLSSGQQETLKWLALLLMTLGHMNRLLFDNSAPLLMWLGGVAFPVFAFLIAYNLAVRQVKPTRYLWPLFIFACFTQPFYSWVWHTYTGNILFTLCLGVLYLGLFELFVKYLPALFSHVLLSVLLFIPALQVDYGPAGVYLIPLLVSFLKRPSLALFTLLSLVIVALNTFAPYALWGLLSLPLIYAVSRFPVSLERSNKWVFYLYYPAHLVLLKTMADYLA